MNLVAAAQPRTSPKAKVQPQRVAGLVASQDRFGNDGLGEHDDRQDPKRRQNGVVGRVVTVPKQIWLQEPSYPPRAPPASGPIATRRNAKMAPAVRLKSRIGPRRARGKSCHDGAKMSPTRPSKA